MTTIDAKALIELCIDEGLKQGVLKNKGEFEELLDYLDKYFARTGKMTNDSSEIPKDLEEAARSKLDDFDAVAYMGNMEEGQSPLYDMQQMLAMFISGSKWDRQQMLKEAVKGEIFDDYDKDTCEHHLTILSTVPSGYKDGDKVHIIIVKDR